VSRLVSFPHVSDRMRQVPENQRTMCCAYLCGSVQGETYLVPPPSRAFFFIVPLIVLGVGECMADASVFLIVLILCF